MYESKMTSGINIPYDDQILGKTAIATPEYLSEHGHESAAQTDHDIDFGGETWEPEEERQLLRRLDFYIIPLVMIMFFTLNLDRYVHLRTPVHAAIDECIFRGNISNALTDNFMKDLHINQEVVNTGNSLVFVGICIGDIPANIAIQKVGDSLFGLLATMIVSRVKFPCWLMLTLFADWCGHLASLSINSLGSCSNISSLY